MNDAFPHALTGDPDVLEQVATSLGDAAADVRTCERTTATVHEGAVTMSGQFATTLGDRALEAGESLTGFGLVLDSGSQALAEYASILRRIQDSAREAATRYAAAADAEQGHNTTAVYYRSLAHAGLGTSFAADQAEVDAQTARTLMSAAERDWANAADQKIRAASAAAEVLVALCNDFTILDQAVANGASIVEAAVSIRAGTHAAELADQATDTSLTSQQRHTALSELTELLTAHGDESAFATAMFASTTTKQVHQLVVASGPLPQGLGPEVPSSATRLRDSFAGWMAAQPVAEQRRVGNELVNVQDTALGASSLAGLAFLLRARDMPSATFIAAAEQTERQSKALFRTPLPEAPLGINDPRTAILDGIARDPAAALTFLTPADDALVRERILFWSSIPGAGMPFATALADGINSASDDTTRSEATRLASLATTTLPGSAFTHTASAEVTQKFTEAFLTNFTQLGAPDPELAHLSTNGTEAVRDTSGYSLSSDGLGQIVTDTARTDQARASWIHLADAAFVEHGGAVESSPSATLDDKQDTIENLMRGAGVVTGGIEQRWIEEGRSADEAVAITATAVGTILAVGTLGAGAPVAVGATAIGTGASIGAGFTNFEQQALERSDAHATTSFAAFTERAKTIIADDEAFHGEEIASYWKNFGVATIEIGRENE